jgi:hypothetical protein
MLKKSKEIVKNSNENEQQHNTSANHTDLNQLYLFYSNNK